MIKIDSQFPGYIYNQLLINFLFLFFIAFCFDSTLILNPVIYEL